MKIAFLNIYNGVINRGAETFVKELAARLSVRHDVSVFQSGDPIGTEKYKVEHLPVKWNWKNKSAVNTLRGRLFVDYWSRRIFFFGLKSIPKIMKGRYDIVIPVNGGWLPALVRIATWISRSKMVISGQSGIGWDDRNNLWSFPNAFVAISKTARMWAEKVNPRVRSVYIPNGVDLAKFKPEGKKYMLALKKPIVLSVAALIPSKRLDLVIKAVAKLKNVSLLVVGDGDLRTELESLGNKLLGSRFLLVKAGFDEMPSLYRTADLFVFTPQASEAFGLVYVEAMASGMGVVGIGDDVRSDIIGEAGILVKDPSNIESLSKAIKVGLNTMWGGKPRKQAEKFDWDEIARKYEKLFEGL